jgi:hypothetical protein
MSRKKSVAAHVRAGTYRADRHGPKPGEAPTIPAVRPKKPKLAKDAAEAWRELAELLADRLRPEDGPQLEQAAFWLATWRGIVAQIGEAEAGTVAFSRLVGPHRPRARTLTASPASSG